MLPVTDVGDVDACPHDIFHSRPRFLERSMDILEHLDGLQIEELAR